MTKYDFKLIHIEDRGVFVEPVFNGQLSLFVILIFAVIDYVITDAEAIFVRINLHRDKKAYSLCAGAELLRDLC